MLRLMVPGYEEIEEEIHTYAPSGYGILINMRNLTPEFFHSTYPEAWQDIYTENAMVVHDPVVQWAMVNTGWKRWSEIKWFGKAANEMAVMLRAKDHGLNHGFIASLRRKDSSGKVRRSLFGAARSDRELTDDEAQLLLGLFERIVQQISGGEAAEEEFDLSEFDLEMLRLFAKGYQQDRVAAELNVSIATIGKRMSRIKESWGTRTIAGTVISAVQRGVLRIAGRW